jgi:hypothetical protein
LFRANEEKRQTSPSIDSLLLISERTLPTKMVTITSPRIKQQQESNKALQALFGVQVLMAAAILWVFATNTGGETANTIRRTTSTAVKGLTSFKLLPTTKIAHDPNEKWPEMAEFYNGKEVISDPQFLLDFAIIGFEKSGSSTFMKWLGAHPQVQCFQEEIYDMYLGKVGTMVWRLYTGLKPGFQYKRGYKSPGDIFLANTIHLLDEYFPKTRLILSLRHPVLYYQSIYNCKYEYCISKQYPQSTISFYDYYFLFLQFESRT